MAEKFDLVIGGGGPVGLALACALQDLNLRILVIEPRDHDSVSADPRAIAMSHGSRLLLEQLGAWPGLSTSTPILAVHVSQRGEFGTTLLTAQECGLPALGYVARYDSLRQAVAASPRLSVVEMTPGARITHVKSGPDHLSITYRQANSQITHIDADLLVIADGGGAGEYLPSAITRAVDFHQSAVLATVRAEQMRSGFAFERFAPEGPIALLPLEHDMALVWATTPEYAQTLVGMPEKEFITELHRHFGDRTGGFIHVDDRSVFPLSRRSVTVDAKRVALIGNAAQTLHPVAGQGFNLGLRDAWELAQLIAHNGLSADVIGLTMARFATQRRRDRRGAVGFTDSLVRVFSESHPVLANARGIGLAILDSVPPLRRAFARHMTFGIRSGL